jgi:two-component system chemotaxis sensor kinase CheA
MDVVRRNIEALRGRIEIQSRPGLGTTFSIWLPLTLAIIDGMVVRVGGERYAFPTLSILRVVPIREEDVKTVVGKGRMLSLQGRLIPLFPLNGFFRKDGAETHGAVRLAVIAESDGRLAAFSVDALLGRQQIVIKKLGEALSNVQGLSGGAILADGCVGLILDVEGLLKVAHENQNENFALPGHALAA